MAVAILPQLLFPFRSAKQLSDQTQEIIVGQEVLAQAEMKKPRPLRCEGIGKFMFG
jgi:hypothetical protein